ncbi:MAG: nitrilase-related carbon-nitrogen hydrolase [Desulfotignum sp.]|nr:nitrilase-related carbon-nitrogen hydrolase [Desulfotignum sp.]
MKPVTLCLAIVTCPYNRFEENLNICIDMVHTAARNGADLVVFPEMNLTGYGTDHRLSSFARPVDSRLTVLFSRLSEKLNVAILAGLAEKANGQIYGSHLVFVPQSPYGRYQKLHIAPNEQDVFSPGNKIPLFEHAGVRFGIQLCYDAHFPELSTAMALDGADLIIFPHASPRGTEADKFNSWMRHLPARAFDNGVFVAAVNQTGENGAGLTFPGLAMVIGPDGKLISRSFSVQNHLHFVSLDPEQLDRVRSHRMRYFLPYRREDLFPAIG